MHENNKYVILTAVEASSIDFSKVKETSADTLFWNNDNSKTFVKYEGDTPSFLRGKPTLTQTEMIEELEKSEWDIDDGNNN
tara:strand:- start:8233 stop:8475 length:243 start_codon:yes stop_codon:yes gene_type:complete